jgi:uncharacterized protein YqeY
MPLMQQIRDKQLAARKSGNAEAVLYTTLLGEAAMIGKNDGNRETSDDEVVAVVKKFIKNINDTISLLSDPTSNAPANQRELLVAERTCLEQFLPLQLTENALEHFVRVQVASGVSNMGAIMAALKSSHAGQYDGKLASTVVKRVLG